MMAGLAALVVGGCTSRAEPARVTLAVYVGVDAVSFSSSGSERYGKFPEYADREALVEVPADVLAQAITDLDTAGFFTAASPNLETTVLPPETFVLAVRTPTRHKELRFYYADGARAAPAYIDALQAHRALASHDVVAKFIEMNRASDPLALTKFVPIATVGATDEATQRRVVQVLAIQGIEAYCEGSIVYGVFVPSSHADRAREILTRDYEASGYRIRFEG